MIQAEDPSQADAFLAVVAVPGFAHVAHNARTLGCVRARLEWRYGTTIGAWRKRYVAGPQGGLATIPFAAWEETVVEDTLPDWPAWEARHGHWSDGKTLVWFGHQATGDRLDHWTSGTPILELAADAYKPTLVVATMFPTHTAHGRLSVLEWCANALAQRVPPENQRLSFHTLWA